MARPRKVARIVERARSLSEQLGAAYKVLAELGACLERLASIKVEPVYARLEASRKTTPYGDYEYPVLRVCRSPSDPSTFCDGYYVTRFRGFGEAFVAAADASIAIAELREAARRALQVLEDLEGLLKRLNEETGHVEAYTAGKKPREMISSG